MKEANSGNPLAQHELGLRYLTGKGFTPDTAKSYYWIKSAAEKKLTAAHYNLGILLNNGWGTEWKPFEAYRNFKIAAEDSMIEALFLVGILFTDNLIVARDYKKAYELIRKAAKSGYKPAMEVLPEFKKVGFWNEADTTNYTNSKINSSDDFIDPDPSAGFLRLEEDSSEKVSDLTLLKELLDEGGDHFKKSLGITVTNDSTFKADSTIIRILQAASANGSPEAQTLLGRCYEKGIGVEKNHVLAAVQYIKAIRLDSPRGARLLWEMIQKEGFYNTLKTRMLNDEPDAQFAWAGLIALGFDNQLTEKDAFDLLQKAASKNHIPAIIELGLCYYSGIFTKQDKNIAVKIWKNAVEMGSSEAEVRIAIANVQEKFAFDNSSNSISVIKKAADNGSLMAQVILAYCYETGTGVDLDKPEAVFLYKTAAQRGSRGAHNSLRRLYDEIRPEDVEFLVIEND